ncbi:EF-hand domain-containing protein [Caulobacter sp. ErkDOM-E]|uniref:EF-hand domain-containing protein n=1 Tax=Caulobacter sp. ErkDOM-E TaxID=3402778 RepID=UPI003AF746C7
MRQLQQSMFTTADADSDGALSLTEFQSIGQKVQGGGDRPPAPPMGGQGGPGGNFSGDTLRSLMSVQILGSDAGSILGSGDTDADGLMSADEISTALAANAPEQAKGLGLEGKMAQDMISALDSDADGALSSDEIASGLSSAQSALQGMGGPPPGGPPPSEVAGQSASASSGASGSSTTYDTRDTNEDGTVSASELLASLDTDENGSLSTTEFDVLMDALSAVQDSSGSALAGAASDGGGSGAGASRPSVASDLMQKLLAQLNTAMTSGSASADSISATA